MKKKFTGLLILSLSLVWSGAAFTSDLKIARIGDFPLENGQVLLDCRVGYRIFGKLDDRGSNAILYPTWFLGRSDQLRGLLGTTGFVDTTYYCVIAVDALGNGVSSSPSNSARQPESMFPNITVADMVRSQYQLLTKVLGIHHLYGLIGGSMGAMQVFQWLVQYPGFADRAVAYVGTPKMTTFDLLLWNSELELIETARQYDVPSERLLRQLVLLQISFMRTPDYYVENVPAEQFADFFGRSLGAYRERFHRENWACQLKAMIAHDIFKAFGGDQRQAATTVRAKVLIIVGRTDHVVNPQPALEFAQQIGAETVVLENNCGHGCVGCEFARVAERIRTFWEE